MSNKDFWEGYVPEPVKPAQQEPKKDLMYSTVSMQERHAAFVDRAVATLEQVKREALAEQPAQIDCCANCLRPKREHRGEACPKPYTTVWHAWDYDFPPDQPAQQEPVAVHQFRSPHCSDWYDGVPDHHDGHGPYEVRTLYTSPPAQRTWEEWFKWWRTSKVADSTEAEIDFADFMLIVRAVEAEYGIKENT
jgi:hypothetical protein